MNYITTTELRTKSTELVTNLLSGKSVTLVHRSKIIGQIKPAVTPKTMTNARVKRLQQLARELNLPKIMYREREKIYRTRMLRKYGKNLS
ncbi:TPA: hypothetical protein DIV55_00035 [Patescibacteria group bacterium]|nr:hypothetical protein [Patescibacteria group bacterium]